MRKLIDVDTKVLAALELARGDVNMKNYIEDVIAASVGMKVDRVVTRKVQAAPKKGVVSKVKANKSVKVVKESKKIHDVINELPEGFKGKVSTASGIDIKYGGKPVTYADRQFGRFVHIEGLPKNVKANGRCYMKSVPGRPIRYKYTLEEL